MMYSQSHGPDLNGDVKNVSQGGFWYAKFERFFQTCFCSKTKAKWYYPLRKSTRRQFYIANLYDFALVNNHRMISTRVKKIIWLLLARDVGASISKQLSSAKILEFHAKCDVHPLCSLCKLTWSTIITLDLKWRFSSPPSTGQLDTSSPFYLNHNNCSPVSAS